MSRRSVRMRGLPSSSASTARTKKKAAISATTAPIAPALTTMTGSSSVNVGAEKTEVPPAV